MKDSKNSQFGTKWINNGTINQKIKVNDLLPEGWSYGRVGVHSEESKKQLSKKCRIAAYNAAEQRLNTIRERYGTFKTETREKAINDYWKAQRIEKTQQSFEDKSSAFKRQQILEEQNQSCLHCNLSDWLGNKIKFELDHIDGDTTNNSRQNLRLLCPNCHSFTDTWRKKKKADVA